MEKKNVKGLMGMSIEMMARLACESEKKAMGRYKT